MSKFVGFVTSLALFISFKIKWLAVVLISMMPLIELKGGIPIGIKLGLSRQMSFLMAFVGSSVVCIPLYFIFMFVLKLKIFKKLRIMVEKKAEKISKKTDSAGEKELSKQKTLFLKGLGVFVFTAIPVPLTGVWTATLIAVTIRLRFDVAVLSIILGNIISGLLILILTLVFGKYLDLFIFALFAIIAVIVAIYIWKLLAPAKKSTYNSVTDENK